MQAGMRTVFRRQRNGNFAEGEDDSDGRLTVWPTSDDSLKLVYNKKLRQRLYWILAPSP